MRSSAAWSLKGIAPDARESAREAARRSGQSVAEWLNSVIIETAAEEGVRRRHGQRHRHDEFEEDDVADIHERLDELDERLERLTRREVAALRSVRKSAGDDVGSALRSLEARLDRLVSESRDDEFERRVATVDRALAGLNQAPADPGYGIDRAVAEISARQRALDSDVALPPAPEGGLDQQLRMITRELASLRRPSGFEEAINGLRQDLREIARAFTEAQPRAVVAELETEVDELSHKVDRGRLRGVNASALSRIDQRLDEVRETLRKMTPAENLAGLDVHLQELARKIDQIAASGQDRGTLVPLETAIGELRSVVSRVASDDALTSIAHEVRALSGKIDQFAAGGRGDGNSRLEALVSALAEKIDRGTIGRGDQSALDDIQHRIANLTDKLDTSRLGNLSAVERGIAELLVQLDAARKHGGEGGFALGGGEVDSVKRDLAALKQNQAASDQRTQDTLESVHGMLERLVDRLAMVETDLRSVPAVLPPELPLEAPVPPPAPMRAAPVAMPVQQPAPAAPPQQRPNAQRPPAQQPRRPIDPNLPADHPLEPGTGTPRGRANAPVGARIAAGQPPAPPQKTAADAPGGSSFIAAARRAAKAAAAVAPNAPPAPASFVEAAPIPPAAATPAPAAAPAEAAAPKRKRSLLISIGIFLLFVGTLHLVVNLFFGSEPSKVEPQRPAKEMTAPPPGGAIVPAKPGETPAGKADLSPTGSINPVPNRQTNLAVPNDILVAAAPAAGMVTPNDAAKPPSVYSKNLIGAPLPRTEVTGSVPKPAQPAAPATPQMPSSAPTPHTPSAPLATAPALPPSIGNAELRNAALSGDPAAAFEIASRYADGRGVTRNFDEAARWFERAAERGLAPAQYRLGSLYEKGQGVKKNLDTARRLYMAAAEKGNAKAMHNLAVLYAEGIDGKPDYASAAHWFRLAADRGTNDSQYNLAILYARGLGVQQNLVESYKWFALAAAQGDRESVSKRDDVAGRLDPASLAAAKAAVDHFVPEKQPDDAVNVKIPPGWEKMAAVAAPTAPGAPAAATTPWTGPLKSKARTPHQKPAR